MQLIRQDRQTLASVCFESFGKANECRKCYWHTPMDTTHNVLSAHAHNLAQYAYVGKGRQQAAGMELAHAGYVLYRALVMDQLGGAPLI